MKSKIILVSGLIIVLLLTFQWSCKKDDNNPPGQDTFTDPRDGHVYETITVDTMVWFAENLDYDTAGAYDYLLKSTNGNNYGKLYTWPCAKVACPSGWHLASDNSWKALLMSMGMSANDAGANGFNGTDQGKRLKSTTGWMSDGNGTDEIGFNALPAGYRNAYGEFSGKGEYAHFWTSTPEQANAAYTRTLYAARDDVGKIGMTWGEGGAASVRCIKDAPK